MRVFIHTLLFRLLGTMPQTPLNTELILWPRVLRTLLKGTLKRRPLCRDVTNRYTLMRWQYTIPSGDISFPKRGFPKWKPLTRDDSYGDYPSKRVFKYRTPLHRKGTVKQGHP